MNNDAINNDIINLHPEFKDEVETQICLDHSEQKVLVTYPKNAECPLCKSEKALEYYVDMAIYAKGKGE